MGQYSCSFVPGFTEKVRQNCLRTEFSVKIRHKDIDNFICPIYGILQSEEIKFPLKFQIKQLKSFHALPCPVNNYFLCKKGGSFGKIRHEFSVKYDNIFYKMLLKFSS